MGANPVLQRRFSPLPKTRTFRSAVFVKTLCRSAGGGDLGRGSRTSKRFSGVESFCFWFSLSRRAAAPGGAGGARHLVSAGNLTQTQRLCGDVGAGVMSCSVSFFARVDARRRARARPTAVRFPRRRASEVTWLFSPSAPWRFFASRRVCAEVKRSLSRWS